MKAPRWWRGFAVCLAWLLWPVAAYFTDVVIRFSVSTSRACSVEGCNFTASSLELAAYFVPPFLATVAWWRWRRRHRSHSA